MPNPKLETYKNKATNTVYDLTDADAQSQLTTIKDGTDIDSFGDVETALTDKVDIKALSQNKETGDTASAGYNVNSYIWIEKLTNAFGSHLFKVTQKVNEGDSWASIKSTKLTDAAACGEIKDLRNAVSTNASAISAIKDGTNIDSFGDVESALADYFPRSEQAVLGAKNLHPKYKNVTSGNAVMSVDDDGICTITGTSGSGDSILTEFVLALSAGRYILTDEAIHANVAYCQIQNATKSVIYWTPNNNTTFEYNGTDTLKARIWLKGGSLTLNEVLKPMLRLASDPDDTYVLYAMTNKELTDAVSSLSQKKLTNVDLNDINITGYYFTLNSSDTASITNKPSELTSAFVMEVVCRGKDFGYGEDGNIAQIIKCTNSLIPIIYIRQREYNQGWGSWYKFTGTVVS